MNTGTLYIIATPIGNLEDVTARALRVMAEVDVLYCEDTRVTRRLLDRYDITVRTDSYREEVHSRKSADIIEALRRGEDVGLVSDAGTPAVSDPGGRRVRAAVDAIPDLTVVPVPGPSAVAAAVSVSGFPGDGFVFAGFPPHKKGRTAFFHDALDERRPVVMYESPHRIEKALGSLDEMAPDRRLCVCRELTKVHETIYRGTATETLDALRNGSMKGEFVIVIEGKR